MKHAIIAPVALLERFSTQSDYHLVLCHDMAKFPKYREFYSKRRKAGDFIILDNSAHELGEGAHLNDLILEIDELLPNEVVLPDRLFFGDDTVEGSREAAQILRKKYGTSIRLMGVPQGRTSFEWDQCCEILIRDIGVDTIGISKDYEVWPGGLQHRVTRTVQMAHLWENKYTQIHLLGWGRKLAALGTLARANTSTYEGRIRGIDSAKPLVYAAHGIELPSNLVGTPPYPRRIKNFMLLSEGLDWAIADNNINVFSTWAKGEQEDGL